MKQFFLIVSLTCIFSINSKGLNYFWIGGTGNWNDLNHWATATGGSTPHTQIPTALDDVFFDANSFTVAGQIVTLNTTTILCRDMTWTGVTNIPTLAGTSGNLLKIYGSLTFVGGMNFTFSGPVNFEATTLGKSVSSGGKSFNNTVSFNGIGGGWTLQDALTTTGNQGYLYLNNGILSTNNQTVTGVKFSSNTITSRVLNMGSSIFNLSGASITTIFWEINPTGLILNTGTSTINSTGNAGGAPTYFVGGSLSYYDLNFVAATSQSGLIAGNNIFHNISFASSGTLNGNNSITNNAVFSKDGLIIGNNSFNNLTFTAGYTYVLESSNTQMISGTFSATGNCGALIAINSRTAGSQSAISHPPGAVVVSFVTLKDISTSGGATFTANNAIDFGNNTGWTINSPTPKNLYWIGNGGNWNDGNHWSLSSGGPASGCSPTPLDNVFFDANSYSLTSQTTTINIPTAYCKDMTWTGVTNNPRLLTGFSGGILKIFGSLTFVAGMNLSLGSVSFEATTLGKTITSSGKSFYTVSFNGAGGEWTLQDDLTCTDFLNLSNGILNTNNRTINAVKFISSVSTSRTLNMGSSIFNLSGTFGSAGNFWSVSRFGMTLNCGTSSINSTGNLQGDNCSFPGDELTYYDLNFVGTLGNEGIIHDNNIFHNVSFAAHGRINGNNTINNVLFNKNGTIQGNNNYNNLTFTAGYTYNLTNAKTQAINGSFSASGSCGSLISINSSVSGSQSTISHPPGAVDVSFVILKDINAIGGATFTANNAIDLGNNTGWIINTLAPKNLYWIGNGGNWSDGNHWSFNSGGSPSGCSPTPADNVFFDASSFSISGQTITINIPTAYCRDMTWTGVINNPTLATVGGGILKIFGSLTLVAGMNLSLGSVSFEATTMGKTITSNGKSFSTVSFNGVGGGWTLQDSFASSDYLYLNNGILTTNNQTLNLRYFYSTTSTARTLNMGSSIFNLIGTSSFIWQINPTGMTLNCGNSLINSSQGATGYINIFRGGNLTYYDLNFAVANGGGSIEGNNIFHDVNFAGEGITYGNNIINNATFNKNGTIQGNNTYNNLTFTAGYTYLLTNAKTQTINSRWLIQGSCTSYILLQSSVAGSFSTVTKTTGAVTGFNIHMRDIKATGGSNFIAYNSVDLGGNSGWSFQTLPPLSNPGAINGQASLCAGATGITYYIAPVAGAISYVWAVPSGATIVNGQGDTIITVNFGTATSGNITVNAFNGCTTSAASTFAVALNYGGLAAVTGGVQVCVNGPVSSGGTSYRDPLCNLVAKVVPSGVQPVNGTINSCVIIDGSVQYYNAEPYVQRHYDIEPATNPATATGTVTLYFKNQEFENFNAVNSAWPDLPTVAGGGNSDPNIATLRVTQYHGVPIAPHNVGNPAPGYYTTSTGVLKTPTLVNYNSTSGFWEVTIQVNGFSGFYVHTNIYGPLPVTLNYLTGTKMGEKHLLNWKVTCNATPRVTLTLERSEDSRNFNRIYVITADAIRCQPPFEHIDAQPLNGLNYYRLKMVDADGKITYSSIVALLNANKGFEIINIIPNPVTGNNLKLNITSALASNVEILINDMQGRTVKRQSMSMIAGFNNINLDVSNLSPGTYIISAINKIDKSKNIRFVRE